MKIKMELPSRRSFMARVIELGATVPLLTLIVENFINRTSYYEIDSSKAQIAENIHPTLDSLIETNTNLTNSLNNLHSHYIAAYHKRHTRLVPYTTKVGKTTVTRFRTEVYYRWEEPSNVPNHTLIETWHASQKKFVDKSTELSQATVDLDRLNEIKIVKQRTNRGSEGVASLAIYTPQIAALLFYEEAIAKLKHGYEDHDSASELVERHDTQRQIMRRSFFKAGAALTGACASFPIVYTNRKEREFGKSKLENEIEAMKKLRERGSLDTFSQYFGSSPLQMIEEIKHQLQISQQTLQVNIADKNVENAFRTFVPVGTNTINSLEIMFGKSIIPSEIDEKIKAKLIAQHLQDKSVAEHRAVYTGLGITGIAVAGTIAATLIPLEIGNEYFANRNEKDN